MKKLIGFLALAVIISSCGNKMTLMKRHYTKGYYLHHSTSVDKKEVVAQAGNIHAEKMPSVQINLENKIQNDLSISASKAKVIEQQERSYQSNIVKNVPTAPPVVNGTNSTILTHNLQLAKDVKVAAKKTDQRKGDANIIVMVILALFPLLCLIAVYLHDGGVTTNFWIDLLLHLTVIGEIIFALLVVLDVVDFA